MYNFKFNLSFVPIESEFIENHMVGANGEYVKVYLYILNTLIKGNGIETSVIAKSLNLLESDVINAIEYWREKGVLTEDNSVPAPAAPTINSDPDPMRTKKTMTQIKKNPLAEKELTEIATIAQELLGKTLSDPDLRTLYWFYDELGFSAEVIMMLLEYCVSKDKRDVRYIEKVAIAWHKRGINDIKSAEAYIESEAQLVKAYYELKKLFGINDRKLSKTEDAYMHKWLEAYNMSVEMVALAYEYCIMAIGKMTFQYMNKIIENWHKLGIDTLEAAEQEHNDFKNKGKKFTETDTSIYNDDDTDYAEFERRMNEKY